MKLIGIIKNETTPKVTTDEVMFTTTSSDSHRGGSMVVIYELSESDGAVDGK